MNSDRPMRRRRGFAAILAITLILLVSATLVALASAFAADARRTRLITSDAQLRQLLTAGAIAAAQQLQADEMPAGEKTIALPSELASADASLTLTATRDGDALRVIVVAALPGRSIRQTLSFAQRQGQWALIGARLG